MAHGAALILGCAGLRLTSWERDFFAAVQPIGIILFARNIETPEQVRALVDEVRALLGDVFVLIDQEGGRVQRLRPPHWRAWPPALDDSARPGAERAFWLRGRLIAAELIALGIDVDCAPLADVAGAQTHPFLRNRCYGTTPEAVAANARALASGLMAGGVLPVLKHLPGHGRARTDSHADLPRVSAPLEALAASDFAAFRPLAHLPLGMTAHVVFEALDPERPATLSPPAIAAIREDIGFQGLLMTDDISMGALSGGLEDRAAQARAAGCDVVMHCNGDPGEMEAVAHGAGQLEGWSAARVARARAARPEPALADLEALAAEYALITGGAS